MRACERGGKESVRSRHSCSNTRLALAPTERETHKHFALLLLLLSAFTHSLHLKRHSGHKTEQRATPLPLRLRHTRRPSFPTPLNPHTHAHPRLLPPPPASTIANKEFSVPGCEASRQTSSPSSVATSSILRAPSSRPPPLREPLPPGPTRHPPRLPRAESGPGGEGGSAWHRTRRSAPLP